MEIKIIDGVEYYCSKNGRMYPVETMKKYIDEYMKQHSIENTIISIDPLRITNNDNHINAN